MKYTIMGYSQKRLIELGLSEKEAMILRWFVDFQQTGKMKKYSKDDLEYFWINYRYISDNLPILHIGYKSEEKREKKKRVAKIINKLVKSGVIKKFVKKDSEGTYVYISIIPEIYSSLINGEIKEDKGVPAGRNRGCQQEEIGGVSEEVNKDSSINYSSIKDNIYPFENFWNDYSKKVGDKDKIEIKFNKLSDQVKILIKDHIPLYILSQPNKQYRKNPEVYINNKSWNDEIIDYSKKIPGKPDDNFPQHEEYQGDE